MIRMTGKADPYPFAEKKKRYQNMSDCELLAALDDAKKAWQNQEEIERSVGQHWHAGKDSSWRADDFHTIIGVINDRKLKDISRCDCGCGKD